MPLPYYSVAAGHDFWTEHWGGHNVDELLAIARQSPLTKLILDAMPSSGLLLEAGCGLGQYVLLLRERGWRAMGADFSVEALAACRRVAPVPLVATRVDALAIRDACLSAYISLGVIEHDENGPDAILGEARRVLLPGGVIVVSVPYRNGVRRLTEPWLRARGRASARTGMQFYQYAFSRSELVGALARHGFATSSTIPYDPARILRRILPRRWRTTSAADGNATGSRGAANTASRRGLRGLVRDALYTAPALRLFGHMLLAVAVKR